MLGTAEDAMMGFWIFQFVDAQNAEIFRARAAITQEGGVGTAYEIELTMHKGANSAVCSIHPAARCRRQHLRLLAVVSDITPMKEHQRQLSTLRTTTPLTGLPTACCLRIACNRL